MTTSPNPSPPLPPPPNDPSAYSPKGDVVTQPNGRLIRAVEQDDGSIVVYVKPYQGQGEVPELILSVIDGSAMTAAQVTGSGLIAAERQRQVDAEGWTLEHDREHGSVILNRAAYYYETHGVLGDWPFTEKPKLKAPLRNLVRAGALYQAAADVAGEDRYHDRAHYAKYRDRVAEKIDALLAEVRAAIGDCTRFQLGSLRWREVRYITEEVQP